MPDVLDRLAANDTRGGLRAGDRGAVGRPHARPPLVFVHSTLPHGPWRHLPDGREYALRRRPIPGSRRCGRAASGSSTRRSRATSCRPPTSTGCSGALLAALRASGLYDDAVIVVAADHGVSLRAGEPRRPGDAPQVCRHRARAAVREAAGPAPRPRGRTRGADDRRAARRSPRRRACGCRGGSTAGRRASGRSTRARRSTSPTPASRPSASPLRDGAGRPAARASARRRGCCATGCSASARGPTCSAARSTRRRARRPAGRGRPSTARATTAPSTGARPVLPLQVAGRVEGLRGRRRAGRGRQRPRRGDDARLSGARAACSTPR